MTEWLMVVITFVYVIATIYICIYNNRGVKASLAQIEEMKREYDNNLKLSMLPYLTISECSNEGKIHATIRLTIGEVNEKKRNTKCFEFSITNVGHDIAKEITYSILPDGRGYGTIFSLPVNESRTACLECMYSGRPRHWRDETIVFVIHYKDLFDNRYTQKRTVSFLVGPEDLSIKTYFISVPKPTD